MGGFSHVFCFEGSEFCGEKMVFGVADLVFCLCLCGGFNDVNKCVWVNTVLCSFLGMISYIPYV